MTKPFNPYETLGVPKDATIPEARKAYRKRAKKTHPDAGGNAEAFAQASRAIAIIEDPERRHRYDQTGSADDEPVQSEWHAALSNIVPAISAAVMAWARDGGALDIEGRDVFADLIRKAIAERHSQLAEIEVSKRFSAKMRKLAKRTKRKDGAASQIARAFEGEAARSEARIADMNRSMEAIDKTLDLLRAHVFDAEKPKPQHVPSGLIMTWGP